MNFRFSEEEEAWRREVREFFQREVTEDLLQGLEEMGEEHSRELYLRVAEKGWLGLSWSREYGGKERSPNEMAIFYEEMGRAKAPIVDVYRHSITYFGSQLIAYGTEEQKHRFLNRLARGEITCCRGFTGPEAGSDLANVQLRAVPKGDNYILNGQKTFIMAHHTDYMVVLTRTDTEAVPKHRGLTMFIVDLNSHGVTRNLMQTLGGNRRSEVFFDNVEVPKINMLGKLNRGMYHAMEDLNLERSGACQIIQLEATFERLIEYVKEARYEGTALKDLPSVRWAIADLATQLQTARLLAYYIPWRQSKGLKVDKEASIGKLYHTELRQRLANTAANILRPFSVLEYSGNSKKWAPLYGEIAWLYRDCARSTISGGTSEIQRHVIAIRGLGLPRS